MRRIWYGLACSLIVLGLLQLRQSPASAQNKTPDAPVTVWLVRHAEKEKLPKNDPNPPLRDEGKKRAKTLADMLGDKGIGTIITSKARRTVDTAAPLASKLKKQATVSKQDSVKGMIDKIKTAKGNVLVVHHSNTVPETINTLRGPQLPALPDIDEEVYNRVFILELKGTTVSCQETTYEDFAAKKEKACQ
jgi:2,3-bisphosphoglycerate-dependent phosphoglycerate mutase